MITERVRKKTENSAISIRPIRIMTEKKTIPDLVRVQSKLEIPDEKSSLLAIFSLEVLSWLTVRLQP